MTTHIKVIVFPGGFNLPLWTAIDRQFFSSRGLDVEPHYTINSVEQLSGLILGRWEIALTGFDNIVAYQEGQGEAEVDVTPDLFAFMGGDFRVLAACGSARHSLLCRSQRQNAFS